MTVLATQTLVKNVDMGQFCEMLKFSQSANSHSQGIKIRHPRVTIKMDYLASLLHIQRNGHRFKRTKVQQGAQWTGVCVLCETKSKQ